MPKYSMSPVKAICTNRRNICQQRFCVQKCKHESKKCDGFRTGPTKIKIKIKVAHQLPSSEIKCGVKNDKNGNIFNPHSTVVKPGERPAMMWNGDKSDKGEWPWQVSLGTKPKPRDKFFESTNFCGAVLIDSETVLTAAHCVWDCNGVGCRNGKGSFTRPTFLVALGFHKTSVTEGEKNEIIRRDKKFGTQTQHVDTRKGKEKGEVIVH